MSFFPLNPSSISNDVPDTRNGVPPTDKPVEENLGFFSYIASIVGELWARYVTSSKASHPALILVTAFFALLILMQAGSIGTIRTKANVCSVQFQPDSARFLAIGSADHKIYCYDLRNLRIPFCTLIGHTKTVSYVKYLDSSTIVSASTDNSLMLWDLSTSQSRIIDSPLQTFTGHTNIKNFVGLSISDGYIATGSETNEVFVYHRAFPMQVLSYKFNVTDPLSGEEVDDPSQFVSCVCWRGQSSTLVAANSSGNIKLLEMV